jgi:hypothetical protein
MTHALLVLLFIIVLLLAVAFIDGDWFNKT